MAGYSSRVEINPHQKDTQAQKAKIEFPVRYFVAGLIPIGFVVVVFSLLAILTSAADGWSPGSQETLAGIAIWWAHYWWMIAIVLASVCVIAAVFGDARAPAKRKPQ